MDQIHIPMSNTLPPMPEADYSDDEKYEKPGWRKCFLKWMFDKYISFIDRKKYWTSSDIESCKRETRLNTTFYDVKRKYAPKIFSFIFLFFVFIFIVPRVANYFRNKDYLDRFGNKIHDPFLFSNSSNTWKINYDIYEDTFSSWIFLKKRKQGSQLSVEEMKRFSFESHVYTENRPWNISMEILTFEMASILSTTDGCLSSIQMGIPKEIVMLRENQENYLLLNPKIISSHISKYHAELDIQSNANSNTPVEYKFDTPRTMRIQWDFITRDGDDVIITQKERVFEKESLICLWFVMGKMGEK